MIAWVDGDTTAEWDEGAGQVVVTVAGVETERRPPTEDDMARQVAYRQELAIEEAALLAAENASATRECRLALTDAVQLAALSPWPTPEEQALIDAQVSESLALFRTLPNPPADLTSLATAVLTLEV